MNVPHSSEPSSEEDPLIPRPNSRIRRYIWAYAALLLSVSLAIWLWYLWQGMHIFGGKNNNIRLAVSPRCGPLSGPVADVNAGLDIKSFNTIVAFGVCHRFACFVCDTDGLYNCHQDSYTDGGRQDGSPLDPPILTPPNPLAGGRSTNGRVWVECLAEDVNATLMDYAVRPIWTFLHLSLTVV